MNGRVLDIDSFAGGGGASVGIEAALGKPVDIAINHDGEALAMHRANHPATSHFNRNIWQVDPADVAAQAPIRMCGNSVCPPIAEALVRANVAVERDRKAA